MGGVRGGIGVHMKIDKGEGEKTNKELIEDIRLYEYGYEYKYTNIATGLNIDKLLLIN